MFSLLQTLAATERSKERPLVRRRILALGLRPHPSAEAWDGDALGADGTLVPLTPTTRTQMARMVAEGDYRAYR